LELTVVERYPECLIGHAGPLAVCIWRGPPTVEALRAFQRHDAALVERHGRISGVTVVRSYPRRGPTDAEVEALEVELAAGCGGRYVGLAVVIEGSGVGAAISYGKLARVLPHLTIPNEAFPRVAEALQWIARLPGQDPALYAAPALAADLELLGRGDDAEEAA
jgi:hypothetical protein